MPHKPAYEVINTRIRTPKGAMARVDALARIDGGRSRSAMLGVLVTEALDAREARMAKAHA